MSTSDRTFNQVKAILGKLDQRIDALRERRTAPARPNVPAPFVGGTLANQMIGSSEIDRPSATPPSASAAVASTPSPSSAATPTPPRSQYGRAVPLRPTN